MALVLRFLYRWLPAIIWMAIIFYFSSREQINLSPTFTINFVIFKSLHIIEYAILYLLIFRSLYLQNQKLINIYWYSIAAAVLYAISDELHQTFVSTREGTLRDVFIDTMGIVIMYTVIKNNLKRLKFIL